MQSDFRPFSNVTAIPSSFEAAKEELQQVRIDNTLIQAQLASKPKPIGVVSNEEFRDWREWRARAASASQFKTARLQFLDNWIKTHKSEQPKATGKSTVASRLMPVVMQMAVLIDEIIGDDVDDLSPVAMLALGDMRDWMQQARDYLQDESPDGNGLVAHDRI